MKNCCNVTNPLRRDGTSQKQRFPLALAESYVQIDERTHADILNFSKALAREINFYNKDDAQPDGNWEPFFQEDLSFVLSEVLLMDLEVYKAEFALRMDAAKTAFELEKIKDDVDPLKWDGLNAPLEGLLIYFTTAFKTSANPAFAIPAMPLRMSKWLSILPDSTLFADERPYSFKDLVSDGIVRLSTILQKLQIAHWEANSPYYNAGIDAEIWQELIAGVWGLKSLPVIKPSPLAYFTSTLEQDIPKVFELMRLCQDSFIGVLEDLQTNAPLYLEQSLRTYPWHKPQNGLFLAFLRLFDYAKDHLNSLGRKQLLYYYQDILRFTPRPAVPDQAALIFQLRKGVERHLLEAGTLLKAGKDPDGKALFYEVPEEIVLNQALVKQLKSVYVEREAVESTNSGSTGTNTGSKPATTGGGLVLGRDVLSGTIGKIPRPITLLNANIGLTTGGGLVGSVVTGKPLLNEPNLNLRTGFLKEGTTFLGGGGPSTGNVNTGQFRIQNPGSGITIEEKPNISIPRQQPPQVAPVEGKAPAKIVPLKPRVINIYASPVANSADGLGAPLGKDEPKWNMFGEPQSSFTEVQRTMPDAELGFGIASPLLMLREGSREVILTFLIPKPKEDLKATPPVLLDTYFFPTKEEFDRDAIAAREYAILNGLRAQFTMAKGWADARIASVFLVHSLPQWNDPSNAELRKQLDLPDTIAADPKIAPVINPPSWNFDNECLLSVKVVLDEDAKPCVAYNESVHLSGMHTAWPVVKLTFKGRTPAVEELRIPAFQAKIRIPLDQFVLQGGQIYSPKKAGTPKFITEFDQLPSMEPVLAKKFVAFSSSQTYLKDELEAAPRVRYGSLVYELIKDYPSGMNGTTADQNLVPTNTEYWAQVDLTTYIYDYLQYFQPCKVSLRVEVSGMSGVVLENDGGKIAPGKPFQPFGSTPVVGSRFYIGSKEIFGKALSKLAITLNWQDMPSDLIKYYEKYGVSSNAWKIDLKMLNDGTWQKLKDGESLFTSTTSSTSTLNFTGAELASFERNLDLTEPAKLETNTARGFLRLELTAPKDPFGHASYSGLYVKEAFRVARVLSNKLAPGTAATDAINSVDPTFPNEPYTPVIKEFFINYTSKADIDFSESAATAAIFARRIDQFFHIQPFGHTEEHPFLRPKPALVPLLPEDGYFYVGLEGFVPPSTLSMLYQLAEGSGDPDLDLHSPAWSLLSSNDWIALESNEILADSTVGMITSGVIRYLFNSEMNLGNTLLDSGLHWLRAKVDTNVPANLKAIDVAAQAVLAKFKDDSNNLAHLEKSLPSGTINGLKINDPEIKQVTQPYASSGGKLPEQAGALLTRVSERLRHKQRSVNVWDYERMVLEQFPGIYKVKCLNHTALKVTALDKADWELAPGSVTVICIPDLRNRNAVNPFEPKTSVHLLTEVENYLRNYISPWVSLRVANPKYEQLSVTCKVGLMLGKDPGYYLGQLELALQRFLSPWAFDNQEDIVFGSSIHRSQLIRFIEQQDYVDFVIKFQMDHVIAGVTEYNVAEAKAATGRSIIVSALRHDIKSGDATCQDCKAESLVSPSQTGCCNNPDCLNAAHS